MSHPDQSWRVAAIHRCCVRYGKNYQWCRQELAKINQLSPDGKVLTHPSYTRLAEIWFRRSTPASPNHIEQVRHAYLKGEGYP